MRGTVEKQSKRSILSLLVNKIKTSCSIFVELVGREELRTQLRKSFFTGLLVVIPISVTIY
ncbi:MAG: hypothetical protein V3R78_07085, partial [Thermodesulfobacteriota bacterium]